MYGSHPLWFPCSSVCGPHDLLAEGYPEEVGRCGQCYNPLAQEVMFIDPRSEEHLVINTLFSLMQHSLTFYKYLLTTK